MMVLSPFIDEQNSHHLSPWQRRSSHPQGAAVAQDFLSAVSSDAYGRLRSIADGREIGAEFIKVGLAVPYDGGRKSAPWCR
jgi:hypothetical protein